MGWAIYSDGDVEGIGHLLRALELNPANVYAMNDLAVASLVLGKKDKAREYAHRVLALDPNNQQAKETLEMMARMEELL